MDKKHPNHSLSKLRFRPYPSQKPQNNNSNYHFNATLAKLQSTSESYKTLFTSFLSSGNISSHFFPQKNERQKSNKKVQFNIIPDFLEAENYEYFKDSYFYYSSSGISSSAKKNSNQKSNSIIKLTNTNNINTQEQNQRWICSNCLSKNAQDQEICFQCRNFKCKLSTNFMKTNSFGGLQNLNLNIRKQLSISWKCIECSYANDGSENYCKNCRSSKTNLDNKISDIKEPFSFTKYWTEGKKTLNEILKNNKENIATSLNEAKKIKKTLALGIQ